MDAEESTADAVAGRIENSSNKNVFQENAENVRGGRGRGGRGWRGRGRGGHKAQNNLPVTGSQRQSSRANAGKPPDRFGGPKEGEYQRVVLNANDKQAIKKAKKEGKTVVTTTVYSKEALKAMPKNTSFTDEELGLGNGVDAETEHQKADENKDKVTAAPKKENGGRKNKAKSKDKEESNDVAHSEPGTSSRNTNGKLLDDNEYVELWSSVNGIAKSVQGTEKGLVQSYKMLEKHRDGINKVGARMDDIIARSDQYKKEHEKALARLKANMNKKCKFLDRTIMSRIHHADILLFDNLDKVSILQEAEDYYVSNSSDEFTIDISDGFNFEDKNHMRYVARWLISEKLCILKWAENPLYKYNEAWWCERNVKVDDKVTKTVTFAIRLVKGFRDEIRNAEKDRNINSGAIESKCWQDRNKLEEAIKRKDEKNLLDPSAPHKVKEVVAGDFRVVPVHPPAKRLKMDKANNMVEKMDTKTVDNNVVNPPHILMKNMNDLKEKMVTPTKKKVVSHNVTPYVHQQTSKVAWDSHQSHLEESMLEDSLVIPLESQEPQIVSPNADKIRLNRGPIILSQTQKMDQ